MDGRPKKILVLDVHARDSATQINVGAESKDYKGKEHKLPPKEKRFPIRNKFF